MRKNRFYLIMVLMLISPVFAGATSAGDVTIKVNGLVCDFCARNINKVFSREKAVRAVEVDLSRKIVTLSLAEGQDLDDERIGKLIRDAGYQLVSIERGGADATP